MMTGELSDLIQMASLRGYTRVCTVRRNSPQDQVLGYAFLQKSVVVEDWRDFCLLPLNDAESRKVWPEDVIMKPLSDNSSSHCRENVTNDQLAVSQMPDKESDPTRTRLVEMFVDTKDNVERKLVLCNEVPASKRNTDLDKVFKSEDFVVKTELDDWLNSRPIDENCLQFSSHSDVRKYFSNTGEKELTVNNFDFVKKTLGLGEPYEVTRKLVRKCPSSVVPTRLSLYCQYFKDSIEIDPNRVNIDGTLKHNRLVSCALCTEGKLITLSNIVRHMRCYHLCDELCTTCSQEIPANKILKHRKTCWSEDVKKETMVVPPPPRPSVVGVKIKDNDLYLQPRVKVDKEEKSVSVSTLHSPLETVIKSEFQDNSTKVNLTMFYKERKFYVKVSPVKPLLKAFKKISMKLKEPLSTLIFSVNGRDEKLSGKESVIDLGSPTVLIVSQKVI